MTKTELKNYIEKYNIEWHKQDNDGIEDILIFPSIHQLSDFLDILTPDVYYDSGVNCTILDGYVAIWMNQICEHYGFNWCDIFDVGDSYG